MRNRVLLLIFCALQIGCIGLHNKSDVTIARDWDCAMIYNRAANNGAPQAANYIYPLYYRKCHSEVIRLGTMLRATYRDKFYSVTREASEALLNEGIATDYVFEASERAHLSYMLALSNLQISKRENAKAELRRANEEMLASIHKSGGDSLNFLLIANLWEELKGHEEALIFYRKFLEASPQGQVVQKYVKERLSALESPKPLFKPLHVFAIGDFPNLIYVGGSELLEAEYSNGYSLKNCISTTGFLLNTNSWNQVIAQRSSRDSEDTVVNSKKMLRMPTTLLMSGTVIAGGLYLASISGSGQAAVGLALGGIYLGSRIYLTGTGPDMRYWSELPSGFILSQAESDYGKEPCAFPYMNEQNLQIRLLY